MYMYTMYTYYCECSSGIIVFTTFDTVVPFTMVIYDRKS